MIAKEETDSERGQRLQKACHSLLATMVSRGALVHFQEGCSVGGHSSSVDENKSKLQSLPKDKVDDVTTMKKITTSPKSKHDMLFIKHHKPSPSLGDGTES